jgi:transposase-like protein
MNEEKLYCPICGSSKLGPRGTDYRNGIRIKRFGCKDCGKRFDEATAKRKSEQEQEFKNIRKTPNVLILDIETSPMEVFVWSLGPHKNRISPDSIISDWFILCWSARWLFQSELHSDVLTPKEAVNKNDRRICSSLYKMIEQADVVIAHNGIRFDIRKINTRFILHGFQKPSTYQVIDTLREAQRTFGFSSNTLNYLSKLLIQKQKIQTDYSLWLSCLKGDEEALNTMSTYCDHDVLLLEEVYLELRGWMPSHPNLALYAEITEESCPRCLSTEITETGEYMTQAGAFDSYKCNCCGGRMRRRKSCLTKQDKRIVFIPTAR